MRSLLVVAVALSLIVAAIAMEAPATLVDRQLDTVTRGRVRLADATGTLWNGTGSLLVLPYGARIPVAWHIDALPLLRSRLRGTLGVDGADSTRASFDVGSEDLSVRGFAVSLPMAALLQAAQAPTFVTAAGGTVDLRADDFAMRRGAFAGGFTARWRGASVPGLRPEAGISLGEIRLEGIAGGADIKGTLSNAGGDVEINGTLVATAAGAARVEARLRPRAGVDPERAKAITGALSMVGPTDESGSYRVVWQASGR